VTGGLGVAGNADDGRATGFHFLDVIQGLLRRCPRSQECDDGRVRRDQGERAVFEFPGGEALGVIIRDFLEFERALKRNRVARAPADVEERVTVSVLLGTLFDGVFVVEDLLDGTGEVPDPSEEFAGRFRGERVPDLAKIDCKEGGGRNLGDEGLGGGNPDLGASANEDRVVGLPGDRTPQRIR